MLKFYEEMWSSPLAIMPRWPCLFVGAVLINFAALSIATYCIWLALDENTSDAEKETAIGFVLGILALLLVCAVSSYLLRKRALAMAVSMMDRDAIVNSAPIIA